jgi:hypothetical protein
MSGINHKKLALIGILWGSLESCAPMASALFEPRNLSDFGDGTVWQKMDFAMTNR